MDPTQRFQKLCLEMRMTSVQVCRSHLNLISSTGKAWVKEKTKWNSNNEVQ